MFLFAARDTSFDWIFYLIFFICCLPPIIRYIVAKITAFAEAHGSKPGKSASPIDKYQHAIMMSANAKEMMKDILLKKVTMFVLFGLGVTLFILGEKEMLGLSRDASGGIGVVGAILAIGFFAVYGVRFYRSGGWKDAGKAFNSMYLKYQDPDYVTEEHWERYDGGPWELKSSYTYDRNKESNFLTWLLNLVVTLFKIVMSLTYIALYILDDVYLIIKHVFFYKLVESYYRKKAKKHYTEFVEKAARMNCFKICDKLYVNDKFNAVAHEVHKEYMKSTLANAKSEKEDFVVFASDLSVDKWYTVSKVETKLTSQEYGDKTIHVYEGAGRRVYLCMSDNPDINNPLEFFAHAFPTETEDDEYLKGFIDNPMMINYVRLYQNVFLRYAKKELDPESDVNIFKFDLKTSTVKVVKVALKDVTVRDDLPEADASNEEELESTATDETFYSISHCTVLHKFSLNPSETDVEEEEDEEIEVETKEEIKKEIKTSKSSTVTSNDDDDVDQEFLNTFLKKNVKKAPGFIVALSVLSAVVFFATICLGIVAAVKFPHLSGVITAISLTSLVGMALTRTINRACIIDDSVEKPKKITAIILFGLSNVLLCTILAFIPFFVSIPIAQYEEYFRSIFDVLQKLPYNLGLIIPMASLPVTILSCFILAYISNNLTKPKK